MKCCCCWLASLGLLFLTSCGAPAGTDSAATQQNAEPASADESVTPAADSGIMADGTNTDATTPTVDEAAPPERVTVGQKAPTFQLIDHNGQEQTLEALLADGPIALVFYRSASW
jgi:hypothetical protein